MYPSQYKEEYPDLLIDHMSKGFSFESFGGIVRVSKQTLFNWLDKFEIFKEAYEIGKMAMRLELEKVGALASRGKLPGFNATAWVFTMKNCCGWHDRQEIDHKSTDGTMTPSKFNLDKLSEEELLKLKEMLEKAK